MAEIRLQKSLVAWGTPQFRDVLKREIEALDISQLPLVQAMTGGSVPQANSVEVSILSVSETDAAIRVKAGIFFRSTIAGCACADDPTPENENNEYCEVVLETDRSTGVATAKLQENE